MRGKLPIIVWGNGGCMNGGDLNRYLLTELASHGYLTIASGPIGTNNLEDVLTKIAEASKPEAKTPPAELAALASQLTPAEPKTVGPIALTQALDWSIAENGRNGSPYYHRLDTGRIAVGGGSCGGVQAIHIAATDPRIVTAFIMNSGTWPADTAARAEVKLMHAPVACVSGNSTDIAFNNANEDFEAITAIPVFRAYLKGVGHCGTSLEPQGGAFGTQMIDWFNWQLGKDSEAARGFVGIDCRYCTDSRWVVTKKKSTDTSTVRWESGTRVKCGRVWPDRTGP